jgi:hypothetical protein
VGQKNLLRKRYTCSETVPAFSVVAIEGGAGDYRQAFTVKKPTASDNAYSATGKISGSSGLLISGEDLVVRYDGTVAVGDRCRPKSGDWIMEKSSAGQFVCIALYEKDGVQVAAFRRDQEAGSGLKMFIAPSGGITGRTGATMGSATCSVVETDANGQLTTTGSTITVYNWARFAACKNGDRYGVAGWINAAWCVVAEDCTDDGSTTSPQSMSAEGGNVADLVTFDTILPLDSVIRGGFVQPTTPSGGTGGGIE